LGLRIVVEGRGGSTGAVVDGIRRHFPATSAESSEGYGRILALEPGKDAFLLCSFLLDMDAEDILTLFWVKMKEFYPEEVQPRRGRSP